MDNTHSRDFAAAAAVVAASPRRCAFFPSSPPPPPPLVFSRHSFAARYILRSVSFSSCPPLSSLSPSLARAVFRLKAASGRAKSSLDSSSPRSRGRRFSPIYTYCLEAQSKLLHSGAGGRGTDGRRREKSARRGARDSSGERERSARCVCPAGGAERRALACCSVALSRGATRHRRRCRRNPLLAQRAPVCLYSAISRSPSHC